MPSSVVNVPGDYFSLAGFELTTYGRFWVTPEVFADVVCPYESGLQPSRLFARQDCLTSQYQLGVLVRYCLLVPAPLHLR